MGPRCFRGRTPEWQSFYQSVGNVERRFKEVTQVVSLWAWKSSNVVHVGKLNFCLPYVDSPSGDRLQTESSAEVDGSFLMRSI